MNQKYFVWMFVGVFLCVAARAGGQEQDRRPDAIRFVELLRAGKTAEAAKPFDAAMKAAIPEQKLREIWQGLVGQFGALKSAQRTRTEKVMIYDIVFVTCEFERGKLDAKVVFNPAGQISGLFFVPSVAPEAVTAVPPYARTNEFKEVEVSTGAEDWRLPGTLSMPTKTAGPFPGVVLVHGSGPNDRDETVLANKPFRDLAWGLATRGVAVLRYEKRTKVYPEKFMTGRITVQEETIDDALAAVRTLRGTKGVEPRRVFVLGHSLGALVAPRIGKVDSELAGLILLAGPTRPLEDILLDQNRYIAAADGKVTAEETARLSELETAVKKVKALSSKDAQSKEMILNAPPAYWLDLRAYDPVDTAKTLKMPVLIVQGGRDYQVTGKDFEGWKQGLGSRSNVTFQLFPKMNHLFIAGEEKSTPAEYEKPGHVAEEVVAFLASWIQGQK